MPTVVFQCEYSPALYELIRLMIDPTAFESHLMGDCCPYSCPRCTSGGEA